MLHALIVLQVLLRAAMACCRGLHGMRCLTQRPLTFIWDTCSVMQAFAIQPKPCLQVLFPSRVACPSMLYLKINKAGASYWCQHRQTERKVLLGCCRVYKCLVRHTQWRKTLAIAALSFTVRKIIKPAMRLPSIWHVATGPASCLNSTANAWESTFTCANLTPQPSCRVAHMYACDCVHSMQPIHGSEHLQGKRQSTADVT